MTQNDEIFLSKDGVIRSGWFKAGRGRFAFILLERYGMTWIMCGILLFIVASLLAIALDYRIFIFTLILFFLIYPSLLTVLYFNFGLKGENYLNVIDHRVEISKNGLKVIIRLSQPLPEDEEEKAGEEIFEEREYLYPLSAFEKYTVGKDYVVFPFGNMGKEVFYLPADSFTGMDDFSEAVRLLASGQ